MLSEPLAIEIPSKYVNVIANRSTKEDSIMMKKIILAGIFMGLICTLAWAADRSGNTSSTDLTPVSGDVEMNTDKLVLEEKGDDYVLYCQRRFDVTSHTIIKNEWGGYFVR